MSTFAKKYQAMIEIIKKSGESVFLSAIRIDDDTYELVDKYSTKYAKAKLSDSTLKIVEYYNNDIENSDYDLDEKLSEFALDILKNNQTGIENNEDYYDDSQNPYNPEDIRVTSKQLSLRLIKELIDSGDLDISPGFQRHFVWNSLQKSRLIESLLLRIPLPVFYFSEDEDGRLSVVDGLQRLSTIRDFMDNKFPLKNLEYLNDEVGNCYYKSDEKKKRKGIDSKYFRWFNMTQLTVNVIEPTSPTKVKYDIFKRINTGGKILNNQEIRNCLSSQSVRDLLKDMINLSEFASATDHSLKKTRMNDQEMALRYIMFYDAYKKDSTLKSSYDGYMESSLDDIVEKYKYVSKQESEIIIKRFSNAMKNAEYLLGGKYAFRKIKKTDVGDNKNKQLLNKALFEAWSVLLSDIPFETVKEQYSEKYMLSLFIIMLDEDPTMMQYLSYGTNGKTNMVYIFDKINELIQTNLK